MESAGSRAGPTIPKRPLRERLRTLQRTLRDPLREIGRASCRERV